MTANVVVVFAVFAARDRKSTRLNSSHDQISYAVFCLKKKKHHRDGPALTLGGLMVGTVSAEAGQAGVGPAALRPLFAAVPVHVALLVSRAGVRPECAY